MGFKDCHFGQFGTYRAIFPRNQRVSGDLIRLRNRSKLVEGNLFAIIDLLTRAKFITLHFAWRVGDDFYEKFQILVVPIFEENGIFMLVVVFFIQSIFTDRNNNFQRKFYNTH